MKNVFLCTAVFISFCCFIQVSPHSDGKGNNRFIPPGYSDNSDEISHSEWAIDENEKDFPALIPAPQKIMWNKGFFLPEKSPVFGVGIEATSFNARQIIELFPNSVVSFVQNLKTQNKGIFIRIIPSEKNEHLSNEYYRLEICGESLKLEAFRPEGLFCGLQTLRQLKSVSRGISRFQRCKIEDWPAFKIRGFLLDVGRNYISVPLLKEQVDVMSAYKLNVLHLHLTDNPGWRLETKKYPELNRPETMSRWPGKFYTQEEFLDLLDYCNERFITLIPELDIPGHCEAFRKAFGIDSMSDSRVKPIVSDLIDELCSLAPEEKMPYIHLGTDEVWTRKEYPSPDLLPSLIEKIKQNRRKSIVWRPGQDIPGDTVSITQLWSTNGNPKPGHPFLDSRLNYLNHLDPLAGMWQLWFDRICGTGKGDSVNLGGILCCWNDNLPASENDILRMNPVYPGMLVYAEATWKGQQDDYGERYLAVLPPPGTKAYREFRELESRICQHRDLFFRNKPFPYVQQSHIPWMLIGPFDHKGELKTKFPVEDKLLLEYVYEGKSYRWWGPLYGGTIFPRHFFGYPAPVTENQGTIYALTYIYSPMQKVIDTWIGFHGWSRSGGRRGGPFPQQGEWHTTFPKVWVNGDEIPPPVWNNPGLTEKSEEIPFSDEDYFYREPTKIKLMKGWNRILLKVPFGGTSWKWMFTFVPVEIDEQGCKEVKGLRFSRNLTENISH